MARSTVCKIMLHLVAATLLCVNGFQFEQFPMKHTIQTTRSVRLEAASLEHDEGNLFSNDDKKSSNGIDRRRALISTSVTALSLGLGNFGTAIRTWAQPNESPKTILVTGCNSGIGFEAARILARQGNTIIMACRTLEKASEAAEKIQAETVDAKLIPVECNLASQESIRNFANNLDQSLDIVCYNAGVALATDGKIERTEDGFELTVGTNHFGHFYLHNKIFPKIQKDSGRIVITASAVHDPDSPGGAQGKTATLGNLEGLIRDGKMFEMVDGQPYNGDKAYKDSKLCNIFFLRELQRQLAASEDTKGISVNAFSPGLITSTGLFRYQNPVFSSIFGVLATNIIKVAESPQWGGAALAYMTTVNTKGAYYNSAPGSSKFGDGAFGKQFTLSQVSKEAQEDTKGKKLWELSEKLVGV